MWRHACRPSPARRRTASRNPRSAAVCPCQTSSRVRHDLPVHGRAVIDEVFVRAVVIWPTIRNAQHTAQIIISETSRVAVGVVFLYETAVVGSGARNSRRTWSRIIVIIGHSVFRIVFGKQTPEHVVSKRSGLNALNHASKTPEWIVTVKSHESCFSNLLAA